jgi:hypothetical protein
VVPEVSGLVTNLRASADYLHENQSELIAGATAAVMAKIMANERAAQAMAVTMQQMAARSQRDPKP